MSPMKPKITLIQVPPAHHVLEDHTSLDDELDHLWRLLHPTKEHSKGILYNPTSSWYAVIVHCLSSGHASGAVRFHQVGTECECVVRKEEVGGVPSSEGSGSSGGTLWYGCPWPLWAHCRWRSWHLTCGRLLPHHTTGTCSWHQPGTLRQWSKTPCSYRRMSLAWLGI